MPPSSPDVPRVPASAGALIYDEAGLLLILKPTYKKGWTIPGGQIDAGESPWEACMRETREECALEIDHARLACVDFLPARKDRPGGMRFLFDCGVLGAAILAQIEIDEIEIEDHRLAPLPEALELLSGPIGRRVGACAGKKSCVYLENGRPVDAVD